MAVDWSDPRHEADRKRQSEKMSAYYGAQLGQPSHHFPFHAKGYHQMGQTIRDNSNPGSRRTEPAAFGTGRGLRHNSSNHANSLDLSAPIKSAGKVVTKALLLIIGVPIALLIGGACVVGILYLAKISGALP